MPGITPRCASSRRQIRQRPNFLYTARGRPQRLQRVYARKDRLPRVLGGMGVAILSTSSGVMTGRSAEEKGVGGEVICFVW